MNRWSIDPPDEDSFSDKPLDVADIPADGDPYPDPRDPPVLSRSGAERPDPAALAELAVLSALEALDVELAKCSTLTRAYELWNCTRRLWVRIEAVREAAASKADELQP